MCVCESEDEEEREVDNVDVLISQVNHILSTPERDDEYIWDREALLDKLIMLLSSTHPRRFNLANAAVSLNDVCAFQTISFHGILFRKGHDMDYRELTNPSLHTYSVSSLYGLLLLPILNTIPTRTAPGGILVLVVYVTSTSLDGPD